MQPPKGNPLARSPGTIFIGRSGELAELCAAVDEAQLGRGRLFLLSGDPGIGKTRLAEEIDAYARSRGTEVLWGRCDETGGAPAYWPWVQLIRLYAVDRDADDVASSMGPGAAVIAQVVPEVSERFPSLRSTPPLEPTQARFRLFDSVAMFLKRAAKQRPLLLVLDDLHAADKPSLLLLRFIARNLAALRVLVVGTFRDGEVGRQHPLFQTLGALGSEAVCRRLLLGGLARCDVARCIEAATGMAAPDDLVDTVFRETDGNPFFVGEVVQLLASEGRLAGSTIATRRHETIPPSVREVLALRLDRLSPDCHAVLTWAAVVGHELALPVLQRLSELPGDRLVALLDEAIAARLMSEIPGSVGRYRFRHALIQEALYRDIPSTRRIEIHRRVGEMLEAIHAPRLDGHLGEIARHFFAAAPGGTADRAVDYAARAGDRAAASMAHEEAVRHYEMALAAIEFREGAGAHRRCELLLRLAETLWRSGEVERAKAVSLEAVELATAIAAADQLARAALAFAGTLPAFGAVVCDAHVIEILERALRALGEEACVLRAQVLARLGEELMFSDAHHHMRSVSCQAVEMARRSGDPAVLGSVLKSTHFALWVPEDIEQRLATGSEIVQLAGLAGDLTLGFEGHLFRLISLLELGSVDGAREELRTCERIARDLRQPYYAWLLASTRALLAVVEGRLGDVRQLADEAFNRGEDAQHVGAALFLGVQRCHLNWLQGRFEGILPALLGFAGTYPIMARSLSCALAAEYSEEGREAEARAIFERLAADGFAAVPRTLTWVSNIALLAEVCAFLRDGRRAGELYALLWPFAERNVVLSLSIALGSGSHFLGRLAATMGRCDAASRHFEDALRMNMQLGTLHWCARTQLAYAEMLLERGRAADRDRAETLLEESEAIGRRLDLSALLDKVQANRRRARASAPNESPASAVYTGRAAAAVAGSAAADDIARGRDGSPEGVRGLPQPVPRRSVFRREGEYWTIMYDEKVCRFRDAKGLRYLAHLLRSPGREFYASELVASVDPPPVSPWRAADVSSSAAHRIAGGISAMGPLLDATSRAEYRRRLAEVQGELEEAERFNDPGRTERAQVERDAILAQLAAATGLHGRARQPGSSTERARLAVRKGIKAVLRKLGQEHPTLGHYLSTHVKTGHLCVYRPDPVRPVLWEE